MSTKVRIESK